MTIWTVGYNIAGCLPDSEPASFDTWEEANEHLVIEMRHYADTDDDDAFDSAESTLDIDPPAMLATVDSILKDDPPVKDKEFVASVEDNRYQRIEFWIHEH